MEAKISKILKFYGMNEIMIVDATKEILQVFKGKPKNYKAFNKASFKLVLLDLGAEEQHIDDWFKVRDKKKAVYTKTALEKFLNECNNNNFPIADAVKICAEKNWQGFEYSWVKNLNNGKQSIANSAVEAVKEFLGTPKH